MKEYYLIGEVAKIVNISTDTLRYYDKIGLIKPAKIKNNGYRYYHIKQFDLISKVILFRGLDVSLKDLKELLYSKDTQKIIHSLKKQEDRINQQMNHLLKLKKRVNKVVNQLYSIQDDPVITVKNSPDLWAITMDYKDQICIDEITKIHNQIHKDWIYASSLAGFIEKKDFLKGNFNKYYQYGMVSEEVYEGRNTTLKRIPSQKCVYTIYKGDYQDIHEFYQKVLKWIKKNHLQITGDVMEKEIINFYNIHKENEYVTEIWIPIID